MYIWLFSAFQARLYLAKWEILPDQIALGGAKTHLSGRATKVPGVQMLFALLAGWVSQLVELSSEQTKVGSGDVPSAVLVDRADAAVLAELDRAKALLASHQWEEAIQSLTELMERAGTKLVPITPERFVPLQTYGHLLLCQLPAEGLAVYRRQVDPVVQRWYEEGRRLQQKELLEQVVDRAFVSSWADDALWLLGQMALEAGEYAEARWYWERLIPVGEGGQADPNPINPPGGASKAEAFPVASWLGYPDPQKDLAAVRARLVCTSILEGSFRRAKQELEQFARLHPEARGRLGGRQVCYKEALQQMLEEAADWPRRKGAEDWPTFAGSGERNGIFVPVPPIGPLRWRISLPTGAGATGVSAPPAEQPTVAESSHQPLCYYPVIVGRWIFVNTLWEVLGWDLLTGKPLWNQQPIYRDPLDPSARAALLPRQMWGKVRCTLTVHGNRLYARMGTPVTAWGQQGAHGPARGYLICLDLEGEGRLLWRQQPEDPHWAFEGTPIADERSVYVAMRRSELGPHVQTYVACLDAETGRVQWRTFVCSAEPPAPNLPQATHQLLTLHGQTLYYNTDLGAVAALRSRTGQIQWLSLYPRSNRPTQGPLSRHWARQLNPCLWDRGIVYVAPADSPSIFAFDGATGQILWQTGPELADAVHLLGVWEDRLIATGDRVYGIATTGPRRGQVVFRWPEGPDRLGYGRGFLANGQIWWPTRDSIHVVDACTGRPIRQILLRPLQTSGGNLLIGPGEWIIATEKGLVCLGSSEIETTPRPLSFPPETSLPGANP